MGWLGWSSHNIPIVLTPQDSKNCGKIKAKGHNSNCLVSSSFGISYNMVFEIVNRNDYPIPHDKVTLADLVS